MSKLWGKNCKIICGSKTIVFLIMCLIKGIKIEYYIFLLFGNKQVAPVVTKFV